MLYPHRYILIYKSRCQVQLLTIRVTRTGDGDEVGEAVPCLLGLLWSSLVKWLVKGRGRRWLAHWGQGWIKSCSYKGSQHQVVGRVLEGIEGWNKPTELTENVQFEGSGLKDWRIRVFTSDAERCYSPPEWAWAILRRSVWGWSCLLGTHHSPPAPESYKEACPCQGFHSGLKKQKGTGKPDRGYGYLFCIY